MTAPYYGCAADPCDCAEVDTVEPTYNPTVRRDWGPGEWTPARHQQVAQELDFVATCYEVKARPFRDRADQHRRAALEAQS